MLTTIIVMLSIALLLVAGILAAIVRWGEGRRLAIFVQQLSTEQKIDNLTRATLARMHDAVRGRGM